MLSRILPPSFLPLNLRRRLSLSLAVMVGLGGLVAVPAPAFAAPSNDNFGNAQLLTGAPVTVTGSSAAATRETGEPNHADNAGGRSIWYSWTATDYGSVDVDLAGSSFDTLLGVYTGESVADLTLIGSVDDTPSGSRQGRISFPVVAGTTYRIAVDGYDGASGSVKIALDFEVATTGVIAGQVVDGQQAGLAGVCVVAYGEDGTGAGYAVTDAAGRYRVNEVEPGSYRLGFNDCGSGIVEEFYPDAATLELAEPVAVLVARETVVDAEVAVSEEPSTDQPVVSGRVTDAAGNPLAGVCVNVTLDQTNTTWQVRTGGDGRYRADVNPGLFVTQFTSCGDQPYVMDQWYDGATYETADIFMASMGRETTGIDARMVLGGKVRGTVTDDDGVGLELVCVDLLDATGERVLEPVPTYSGGNYAFENVLPGTYFVGFRNCRSIGPFADEYYQDADTFDQATPVIVLAGGTVAADGVLERIPPPDTVIITGPGGGTTIASTTATFTFAGDPAEAAVSFMCQIDSRPWAVCTNPKSFTGLSQGQHTFRVYAIGRGGVEDETEAERTFRVDTSPPNTFLDSGPAAGSTITTNAATFEFRGTAGDTAKLQCQLDTAAWADCTSPLSLTDLSEGAHTMRFRAQDAVGNQDQSPFSRAFTVDTMAPDTGIDSGPTGAIAADTATFEFHGTAGDTARIQCRVDGAAWADCTSPLSLPGLDEGDHTIAFRAEDAAGNQDQTPASRSFTVDTIAPDTTIDSGPTGLIATDEATFTFHGTEGDTTKLQCRLDDAAWADCTSPTTFDDLDEGDHTVAFRAEDAAGNQDQTPATRELTVDTEGPDTTIDSVTITGDTATFTFHGTPGDTARIRCRIDGVWEECTSPTTFENLSEGDHFAVFEAQDAAGNWDQVPATWLVSIDTVAPDTTIDSGPAAGATIATRSTSFTFHGTAGDTAKLQCRIDGSEWTDCTSPANLFDLGDGAHGVEFRAVDAAGNFDASPAMRTFQVQLPVFTPPQTPPQALQPKATTRLTLTAPKNVRQGTKAKVSLRLSGVPGGTVVIRDGRKIIKTIKVKGKATVKLRLKKLGKHRLTAAYAGSTSAKPAKSAVRTVVVKRKR